MNDETSAGQAHLQNQYLQASHNLITWIEASKSSVERLIDAMPHAFAVLDPDAGVQRANDALARLIGGDMETCLGFDFTRLLSTEDARAFKAGMSRALARPPLNRSRSVGRAASAVPHGGGGSGPLATDPDSSVSIETSVRDHRGLSRHFVWQISRFDGAHPGAQGWVSVFGSDVTALRSFQEKLAHVFATLPIGVMQVDEGYRIVDPVSSRTGTLLARADVVGRSLHEVLFAPCWDSLTPREKESAGLLHSCLGGSDVQFDLVRDDLPRLVCLKGHASDGAGAVFLGLTFQPVVRDGLVRGFLVLVEDRSEFEALNRAAEAGRRRDEADATRYVECARLDVGLLNALRADLEAAFVGGTAFRTACDPLEVARVLHRLKGIGRFARMSRLKDLCHALEEKVLAIASDGRAPPQERWGKAELDEVDTEVRSVLRLARWSLCERAQDGRETEQGGGRGPFAGKLEALGARTAEAAGKEVVIECGSPVAPLRTESEEALQEALVHVVTNAVDHGIESPDVRSMRGKSTRGLVRISFAEADGEVVVTVEDDGGGVDRDRVISKALERGLLDAGSAALPALDWLALLFEPRFSTRDAASETSGRGVGLGAARAAIESIGGSARIETRPERGTTVVLRVPASPPRAPRYNRVT